MFAEWLEKFGWIVALGALWLGAVILHWVIRFVCHRLDRRFSGPTRVHLTVLATMPMAAMVPLLTLLWTLTVVFSLEIVFRQWVGFEQSIPLVLLRKFAILGFVAWWFLRWNRFAKRRLRRHVEEGEIGLELAHLDLMSKLVTLLVVLFGFILALQIAGVDMRAIVTLGGFGALAVGLAGKDVFANLFAGIMLYLTRPFVVTDTISMPEKGVEGVVEKIGWYLTRIRNVDKRPQYLPNSLFSTAVITNQTRMTHRRIECKLGLRYGDITVVLPIVEEIRQMLHSADGIDHTLDGEVWFTEFGASSLDIFVRTYTVSTDWTEFLKIQQEVLLQCAAIIHRHGADFAFSTTTVDLDHLSVQLNSPST